MSAREVFRDERGEYTVEEVDEKDWWCPSESRWSMCPGPCPDGTPHGPERVVRVMARIYRRRERAQ